MTISRELGPVGSGEDPRNVETFRIPGAERLDEATGFDGTDADPKSRRRLYTVLAASGALALSLIAGGAVAFGGGDNKVEAKPPSTGAPEKPGVTHEAGSEKSELSPTDQYVWAEGKPLSDGKVVKAAFDGETKAFQTIDELAAEFLAPEHSDLVHNPQVFIDGMTENMNRYAGVLKTLESQKFWVDYKKDEPEDPDQSIYDGLPGASYDFLVPAFREGMFGDPQNGAETLPAANEERFAISLTNTALLGAGKHIVWKTSHPVGIPSNDGATHVSALFTAYDGSEGGPEQVVNMEVQPQMVNGALRDKIISLVIEDKNE